MLAGAGAEPANAEGANAPTNLNLCLRGSEPLSLWLQKTLLTTPIQLIFIFYSFLTSRKINYYS